MHISPVFYKLFYLIKRMHKRKKPTTSEALSSDKALYFLNIINISYKNVNVNTHQFYIVENDSIQRLDAGLCAPV